MPNVKSDVESQTMDVKHGLPPSQSDEHEETGQKNARAALPAQASREEPQNLRAGRDSFLDRLARLQADLENIRKRAAKEQEQLRENTLIDTVKLLLPILNSFEQALQHTDDIDQFRSGVRLIYRQLLDALKTIGVWQIPLECEGFNPHYQEAIQAEDTSEAEDNRVLEVLQHGYKLKDASCARREYASRAVQEVVLLQTV
jgi:molecular chaperone GrpE